MKQSINVLAYCEYSKLEKMQKLNLKHDLICFVSRLVFEYPHFFKWFDSLFLDAVELKNDREIIICKYKDDIAGIAILKNDGSEKKICTLKVQKEYRGLGIGKSLINRSIDWLESEKPLITIRKTKRSQFCELFRYYDFDLEQENYNYYRIGSTELVFNGELPEENALLANIRTYDWSKVVSKLLRDDYSEKEFLNETVFYWYKNIQYV